MAIRNYEVKPLFAVPYLRADISHAISDKQIEYIKNLKMVQNPSNLISENLYIFEESELKSIKDAVQEALDIYAAEVMGIEHKLYVTQSWSLINLPKFGMHGHNHPNSLVSGSFYYCDLPTPAASMIFHRHNSYQQLELDPPWRKGPDAREIRQRLVSQMINEAARALGDGIVGRAGYVDLAMVMGTGFPPFRGGLLRFADTMHTKGVLDIIQGLAERHGDRFTPAPLLKELAGRDRRFYDAFGG